MRRLKEDLRRFDGTPIFPPRYVKTVPFRLTGAEAELYNRVTRYVQDYFDKAKENRSISLALMILQRRLTSSSHAIYESLIEAYYAPFAEEILQAVEPGTHRVNDRQYQDRIVPLKLKPNSGMTNASPWKLVLLTSKVGACTCF